MFKDSTTRPAQGKSMPSQYMARYSILGLATARLISSVALSWSMNDEAEVVSSTTHVATRARSRLKFVLPVK